MNVPTEHLLVLSAFLFGLGILGFLLRRNVIIVLASIELMLNSANLVLLAGSRHWAGVEGTGFLEGPILVLFVILVAAAEAAIGLALIIALFRLKQSVILGSSQSYEVAADSTSPSVPPPSPTRP
ncbi:MAG: NADH-quinone oxidoreductase subunit NuoK [Planctomycetota bacterium]